MSRPSGFRARALQGQARRSPRLPKAVGFTSSPEERRAYHAAITSSRFWTGGPWTAPGLRTAPTNAPPTAPWKTAERPPVSHTAHGPQTTASRTAMTARVLDLQRTIMPNAPRVVSPSARSASRATGSGTRTANLRHWARNVTTSPSWMRLSKGTQATWPRAPCTSRPIASNECPKMKVGLELFSDC